MEEAKAREILGKNFIGIDELKKISGTFSLEIPAAVPEISYDEVYLKNHKASHLLVLCVEKFFDCRDISIIEIKNKIAAYEGTPCFYNQDWYLNEQFINKPLELKWLLISKSVIDESRAMPADKIVATYKLNSAVELTYAFFVNYFVNNAEKLWNNDYVWCSDVDDKGDQIYVGRYTDASGLNADGFEIHRHLRIKKNYGVV
ncbi:hypothetical protein [Treponema sp. C6A8]|uniref:hypothetical protein n=1 Tax=Treponema sp. C6A8 TaxID=1410609 RepID=UPI000484C0F7|nr:hypothetical protein [Treponema sp. C6A8]